MEVNTKILIKKLENFKNNFTDNYNRELDSDDDFTLAVAIACFEHIAEQEEAEKETISEYQEGEAVLYQNGNRFELGIVKRVCGDNEYFINYHTGDTAARTHARNLHKIANGYAFHVIRLDTDGNERR